MPVLKNKTQGNYVNVYKGIAMDPALSLRDRAVEKVACLEKM